MRMRKKPWAEEELRINPNVIKTRQDILWHQVFNNNNPVNVEIGVGKGKFITESALLNPNINYVGLEKQKSVCAAAAKKITELKLENVRILWEDAANITEIFSQDKINRIYINFCDPWPKTRNAKRRLTHRSFLNQYKKVLKEGGAVEFKTDNKYLFHFSLNEFLVDGWAVKNVSLDLHNKPDSNNIVTEYESKFIEKGIKIFRIIVEYNI